eukprot:CAMPEP_0174951750 /NCGR_PEP_ID=MMETSP1355-20121228/95015_1 /TAXON_ID=464990 /ORGANISM="Hemiselmis tepida, Strain CCMP443" /LENGTH=626 /DNA_ID=CAMNT_0016199427 /DNA_START=77 /DNA_END=1957 /DNA_ORIENTATION=+
MVEEVVDEDPHQSRGTTPAPPQTGFGIPPRCVQNTEGPCDSHSVVSGETHAAADASEEEFGAPAERRVSPSHTPLEQSNCSLGLPPRTSVSDWMPDDVGMPDDKRMPRKLQASTMPVNARMLAPCELTPALPESEEEEDSSRNSLGGRETRPLPVVEQAQQPSGAPAVSAGGGAQEGAPLATSRATAAGRQGAAGGSSAALVEPVQQPSAAPAAPAALERGARAAGERGGAQEGAHAPLATSRATAAGRQGAAGGSSAALVEQVQQPSAALAAPAALEGQARPWRPRERRSRDARAAGERVGAQEGAPLATSRAKAGPLDAARPKSKSSLTRGQRRAQAWRYRQGGQQLLSKRESVEAAGPACGDVTAEFQRVRAEIAAERQQAKEVIAAEMERARTEMVAERQKSKIGLAAELAAEAEVEFLAACAREQPAKVRNSATQTDRRQVYPASLPSEWTKKTKTQQELRETEVMIVTRQLAAQRRLGIAQTDAKRKVAEAEIVRQQEERQQQREQSALRARAEYLVRAHFARQSPLKELLPPPPSSPSQLVATAGGLFAAVAAATPPHSRYPLQHMVAVHEMHYLVTRKYAEPWGFEPHKRLKSRPRHSAVPHRPPPAAAVHRAPGGDT